MKVNKMKVKPNMIQDDFMGDFYLGCPNCQEAIVFPLGKNPNLFKPKYCTLCGAEFDWSEFDKERKDDYESNY